MKRVIVAICTASVMLLALTSVGQAQETTEKIRVGVYDNRAIALAYFGSDYNAFLKKRSEYHDAQTAGDSVLMKELDTWVEKFQKTIHYQGFCRVPVDDLLLLVKDKIPALVKSTGVDLISWYPDYTGSGIEIVDITDELVALFNPSEKKLKEIAELKNVEPVALSAIDHEH